MIPAKKYPGRKVALDNILASISLTEAEYLIANYPGGPQAIRSILDGSFGRSVDLESHPVKDPHVFPFIVKGLRGVDVKLESRRSKVEAYQTIERFRSEGFETWLFHLMEGA